MPVFNYAKKEVNVKVVYYGPGLSGKTTNLQQIHDGIKPEFKGKLVSLATQTDRTLFFDFMPLELGSLGGYKIRLHLYTVPGQVHYNATRKLVLKGVDGVVFIADSQRAMADANVESILNLEKNLQSYGKALADLPFVIQANKRDLEDIIPLEELGALLNRYGAPLIEAVASEGNGALETLTEIVRMVIRGLRDQFKSRADDEEAVSGTVQEPEAVLAPVPEPVPEPEPAPEPDPVCEPEPSYAEASAVAEAMADQSVDKTEDKPEAVSDTDSDTLLDTEPVPEPGPVPEPPRPESSWREPETAVTDNAQPIRVKVPVEGIGTLELSISITARIVEEDERVEVQVKSAAVMGTEPEPALVSDTDSDPVSEPGPMLEPEPETESESESESHPLPPLVEESPEPLVAPLDGQEDCAAADPLDLPAGPDEDEKILIDDDLAPDDGMPADSPEPPLDRYDPTAKPIDLFAENVEGPGPEEPAPKKKGFFGMFKK